MEDARELLDSLMGVGRNTGAGEPKQKFSDRDVCKFYLCGFCPHECFQNTKKRITENSPLGPCTKYHSDLLVTQFEGSNRQDEYRVEYEEELFKVLARLIEQLDNKIKREQARLDRVNQEREQSGGDARMREDIIAQSIRTAEALAEQGELEESQRKMREAENLKTDIGWEQYMAHMGLDKVSDVCHECGLLIDWRSPTERRAREEGLDHPHAAGLLHQGYKAIRAHHAMLTKKYADGFRRVSKSHGSPSRRSRSRRRRSEKRSYSRSRKHRSRDRRSRSRRRRSRSRDRRRR